jgi:hypothetical protein
MGGALAAAGVAGAGLALRQAEATRWNDSTKCPQPKHQSCSDTPGLVHRWETMAIAGGASVGVLAVTAVVLFVLDRPAKRDAQQARFACLPSGPFAQIDCRLSF